jgi:excinuclease ABC subunit B
MLVEHGFRLPSALDNRPLHVRGVRERVNQCVYVSATPRRLRARALGHVVEQVIRPTGLVDPEVDHQAPTRGQVDDLVGEVREGVERGDRVLVTTLTKKHGRGAHRLPAATGVKVRYLHSDIDTIERMRSSASCASASSTCSSASTSARGLDLPEVSLVAVLDADKEGFLRSETSLIQTMGRAARNVDGRV